MDSRHSVLWTYLARFMVVFATLVNGIAAVLTLRHGHLVGLVNVGFLLMQPTLYRGMTYGL